MKSKHFAAALVAAFSVFVCVLITSCGTSLNPVYHTITYSTEHGTAPQSKQVQSGTKLQADDLPALTAQGYTFDGWYIGSSLITPELGFVVSSDITLTTKWTQQAGTVTPDTPDPNPDSPDPNQTDPDPVTPPATVYFTITYESEYGDAPEPTQIIAHTAIAASDLPTLLDDDHIFNGWYLGNTEVTVGFIVHADITLTAWWEDGTPPEVYYTVSYVTQFEDAPPPRQFLAGAPLTVGDLLTLYHDGYIFDGWYFGDTKMYSQYPVTQDMVLVARWTPVDVTSISMLIGAASNATQSEIDFELTATKAGSNYTITATSGYDLYFWSVDNPEEFSNFLYASEINILATSGEISPVLTSNTLLFSESLLPPAVVQDGTYVVYCQAIKVFYDEDGQEDGFELAGLEFVTIRLQERKR